MAARAARDLRILSEQELTEHIVAAVDELSARGTHDAFAGMLQVAAHAGERVGDAARSLAETTSWTEVGTTSGTTKQAAWSRWRG